MVVVTLAPASSDSPDRIPVELAGAHGLRHVGAFPLTSIGVHCLVFEVPANRAMDEVLRGLAADRRVESAQPNQVFRNLAAGPPDPYASFQYGARAIRAPQAHRWATGRGVTVAVIDTGIETEHPDLLGRVAKTANFVDGGAQSFAQDRHGTAVAGVIGARANNNEGIFGVAPEADLIGIKACWHSTARGLEARCSSWTLAKAIDFAVSQRNPRHQPESRRPAGSAADPADHQGHRARHHRGGRGHGRGRRARLPGLAPLGHRCRGQ